MIAAKHFDPVIGIDIHIIQPPGPVPPLPIPHPFIGMVFDVFDYLPFIGATVFVNGVPRATAGTEAKNIPHFPIGGMFVMPPGNEGEIFMGSATVLADGEPLSRLAMPVLSCQSIGMIAPMRKKVKTTSMVLPTSLVLSIPMGRPVMVGGPPTISMMALGMRGAMGGLKKLGKIKKIQKLKKAAGKGMKDLGTKALTKFNHKVAKKFKATQGLGDHLCKKGFEPVDLINGRMVYEGEDFSLSGPLPLTWTRAWYSDSGQEGLLGHGWASAHDLSIYEDVDNACYAVRLPDGRITTFPLDIPLAEERYNRGEKLTLKRAADGTLSTYDHAARIERRYVEMDAGHHRMVSMGDPVGNEIGYHYDGRGHLKGITDSVGRELEIDTDDQGRALRISVRHRGASRILMSYTYNKEGDMTALTDALGQSTIMHYERHLMKKKTDRNGQSFYWRYDGPTTGARCVSTWGDGGIIAGEIEFGKGENHVTDSLGRTTIYHYDEHQLCTAEISPKGAVTRHEYTDFMEPYLDIDPLGRKTGYSYDDRGNLTAVHSPDGGVRMLTYDAQDRPLMSRSATGDFVIRKYDGPRLKAVIESGVGQTVYEYDDEGRMSIIRDSKGVETNLEYDRDDNLARMTTPEGGESVWRYDVWGRCVQSSAGEGLRRQHFEYDPLDRVTTINQPDGNVLRLDYNAYDEVTHAVDRHHKVGFDYTPMGSLIERREDGRRVRFHYDSMEQLDGITNEQGEIYSFDRDRDGDITTERGFDGLTRHYRRDLAGQVVEVARPGNKHTTYEYDRMGRILRAEHSDGTWEAYTYDLEGRLIEAVNQHGSVELKRDDAGRVITEIQEGHTVDSLFDKQGRRIGLHSSLGAKIDLTRDEMGRVTGMKAQGTEKKTAPWEAAFTHNIFGQEVERMLPGGIKSSMRYDAAGRPIEQRIHRNSREMRHRKYQWAVNDRLSRMVDEMSGGQVIYSHDDFGNLAGAMYEDKQFDYKLPDEVGNLYRTEGKKDRKYGKGGQLQEMEGHLYDYDEEGNLIAKESRHGRWFYDWYGGGMLKSVQRPDGEIVSFEYDALGRRTAKTFDDKVTRFVWDGNVPLHEWTYAKKDRPRMVLDKYGFLEKSHEEPTPEVTTWVFDEGTFKPAAKIVGEESYSIITDYLGTPVEAFASDGEQVWTAEYDIYGKRRKGKGEKCFVPFRRLGQYEDEETGLFYNMFRYYAPQEGVYLSQDRIGIWGNNQNMYAYVYDTNCQVDIFGLNVTTGAGRTHVTYQGIKNGKPYTGYASAPTDLGLAPDKIIERRYGGDFSEFGGIAPESVYDGEGIDGKHTARGMEQRLYEADVKAHGKAGVANSQNPVGPKNRNRVSYLDKADAELKAKMKCP